MSKVKIVYICSKCGAEFLAWQGKCTTCGEWNSLAEEARSTVKHARSDGVPGKVENLAKLRGADFERASTGFSEFDRVLGGGIVSGSLILLGGEPGIGKSTLILQTAIKASQDKNTLYISGEESSAQVKLRAERLQLKLGKLAFLGERNLDIICATLEQTRPDLAIIDSIQTMYTEDLPGEAGSITQIRFATQKLMDVAKRNNLPIFLIGHVTKEGNVAGPKTLEHLVDVVLYLEGERYHSFRLLRGVKNRFGPTDETGVFEMTGHGLVEVKNPSGIFLEERKSGLAGSCVTVAISGMRPFLVEAQALCSTTIFGYPKRAASGIDFRRLELIIAVLTKRAKLRLGNQDIYVNIAGGFRCNEPAVDLAIALAIFSALTDKPLPPDLAALGEIGLSGELRRVNNLEKRVKEAVNLGFRRIILPEASEMNNIKKDAEIIRAATVGEAIERVK
ncbi:DNA repair protein RadA [bacterium (Candidatus Torokbacteria) CG09_land_8_20_14_0_10_42_11]|nr:MAG: DNA repair protein RadA [bacterium (Candidatus Torokbacteria) CG09_land_8_20_14_0_10_42_11]